MRLAQCSAPGAAVDRLCRPSFPAAQLLAQCCCQRIAAGHRRRMPQPAYAETPSSMPRNAMGERDATQAEKISGFAEKPLGFYDTSHIIRGPDGLIHLVGLSAKKCSKDAPLLSEAEANKLRNQTPGWRLVQNAKGQPALRQEWKVKDFAAGLALFERVALVAEEAGHHPDLHLEGYNCVTAELSSHSLGIYAVELSFGVIALKLITEGGLSENDFIIAARINAIYLKDLLPKPKSRFWA